MKAKLNSIKVKLTITIILYVCVTIILVSSLTIFNGVVQFDLVSDSLAEASVEMVNGPINESSELSVDKNSVEATVSVISKAKENYFIISAIILIIFLLTASIIAYILMNNLLKPLTNFEEAMRQIDENLTQIDFEEDVPIEIKNLQITFKNMANEVIKNFERQKQFNHNVAHELKTPIASMMMGIKYLQEYGENLRPKEYYDVHKRLEKQIKSLNSTVNSIRALSSNQVIFKSVFPIKPVLEDIKKLFKKKIFEKSLKVVDNNLDGKIYADKDLFFS